MNCLEFDQVVMDVARSEMRGVPMDAVVKQQALMHTQHCSRCASCLASEKSLTHGLQAVAQKAVEALEGVLDDATARPAERISAARAILDFALKGHDAIETEKRLAAIEEAFELLKEAKK